MDAAWARHRTGAGRSTVPVEHRLLGLDRRSFLPGAVVIAIWLLWAVVVPRVNDAVAYDDTTRAGERIKITNSISFAPGAGWNVISGFRTDEAGAAGEEGDPPGVTLSRGNVAFVVSADTFSGTPDELLDQIDKVTTTTGKAESFHATQRRFPVTTTSGESGVGQGFSSVRTSGVIVAFVIDGTGYEIQVVGPPGQSSTVSEEISTMVESIGPTAGATS